MQRVKRTWTCDLLCNHSPLILRPTLLHSKFDQQRRDHNIGGWLEGRTCDAAALRALSLLQTLARLQNLTQAALSTLDTFPHYKSSTDNMNPITLILAGILPFLAFASPVPAIQAGGPAIVPFDASCTLTSPLPYPNGYKPKASFVSANLAYSAYFDSPREPSAVALQCFEQCNGLNGCKSAFLGYQIPTPKGYYGTPGGDLTIACIMFTALLGPDDFVPAPREQYQNSSAANIFCA